MVENKREEILSKSRYAELWARVNKVQKRLKDKYRGKSYFPIGTFRPICDYPEGEDIPESEIYFFKLDTTVPNNASSICLIGTSGCFKTTLIKTLTYYNSKLPNTKIGIMDLKETAMSWEKCNRLHNNKGMLYPKEPDTLNIEVGVPLFATRQMMPQDKRRVKKMNLSPEDFADLELLTGLGFSPIAKQHLYKLLRDGVKTTDIMKEVEVLFKKRKMTKPSYDNIMILMDNMIRSGFIAKKDFLDINKIWDEKRHWAIGFNNKETPYLSVFVDKILNKVFDRATSSKGRNERYWIVVDDCQKAFGSTMSLEKYPSVQTGISTVTLWRSAGINMVFAMQCLTKGAYIRLADGRLKTIEELYDMQFNETLMINNCKAEELDKYSVHRRGSKRAKSKKPLIENMITKSKIFAISKETGKRKKYIIKTRGGYKIEVTDRHKLYVNIAKATGYRPSIKCLPVEEIKVGQYLISNNFENIDVDNNIKVDMLMKDNKYYKKISNDCNFFREGKHKLDKGIKIVNKVTPELARLMGYVIADGCIVPNKQTILFNNSSEDIINDYIFCFKKVFGLEPNTIRKEKDKDTTRIIHYSASVIEFLELLGANNKKLKKRVPDFIMKSSLKNKRNFVRAYADCDGCLHKTELTIASICINSIQSIHHILKEFNIGSTITKLKPSNYQFKSDNPLYILRISNKKKYMECISSLRFKYNNEYNERSLVGDIKFFAIKSITVEDYEGDYYNVSVENNDNYFTGSVGSLLSKNSPTMLNEEIYSDIKHFFIYRTGNINTLSKYIPNKRILDQIKQLRIDQSRFVSECIHVYPDRHRFVKFYPFNSQIAN